jgi:hypothetical protein
VSTPSPEDRNRSSSFLVYWTTVKVQKVSNSEKITSCIFFSLLSIFLKIKACESTLMPVCLRAVDPEEMALIRHWLSKHIPVATDTQETIELFYAISSAQSRSYQIFSM